MVYLQPLRYPKSQRAPRHFVYFVELFDHDNIFYLAQLFRHAKFYLAEQFRHAMFYLAELFRQIAFPIYLIFGLTVRQLHQLHWIFRKKSDIETVTAS